MTPTDITAILGRARGLFVARQPVNSIGEQGRPGFGVGICPVLPAGYTPVSGYIDPLHPRYGNYTYSDGSIMVWVPAFWLRIGHASSPRWPQYNVNAVDILPFSAFASDADANAAGYWMHDAFINAGAQQLGVFVDKFMACNNGGVASSLPGKMPLVSASATGNSPFSGLTGAPTNAYHGAIVAAKTRGAKFHPVTMRIYDALAQLATAHGQAAVSTAWCAWYDPAGVRNFPLGNNSNALTDANLSALTFISAGASGTPNLALTGSASNVAMTAHNGQLCGVIDINGNAWEIAIGLTCQAATLNITGVALTNPCRLTITAHGCTTGQVATILSVGGTTQLNDKLFNLTVVDPDTVSLDGVNASGFGAYTSGGTCTVGTFHALKTSVDAAAVTSGTTLATDHWGATGIAAQFDLIAPNFATTYSSNGFVQRYGNGANAVFSMANAAARRLAMLGLPTASGVSVSGSNLMGADYFYQHVRDQLCVLAGGYWYTGSNAGFRARHLDSARNSAAHSVGFRAASYL